MKKYITLFLFVMLLGLTGCQNTVQLDVPTDMAIDGNILTFSEVSSAIKYRIEVTNVDTEQVNYYIVTQNQNLDLLYFQPGEYTIAIQAVGDKDKILDSLYSTTISYTQIDLYLVNSIEGLFLTDPTKVNWLGRTYYDSIFDVNYFYFTASGFEVTFEGTRLEATLSTGISPVSYNNPAGKEPYLEVFIDGENDPTQGDLIVLYGFEETYVLAEDLEEGIHTVRVLKRSESIDSRTGLMGLETDGHFLPVNPLRSRKIEVIAASSSAGFGNLALSSGEAKTTANSDGLRAYAFLAARMLDAEINIFSASGWPLVKGPWTGDNNIPSAYDYVNVYSTNAWNHSNYEPDVIIVNLGTNDWSYIVSQPTGDRPALLLAWEDAYVDFIGELHDLHPQAIIVIVYGLMNETSIYTPTLNAVSKAHTAYPGLDLFSIQLPSVNAEEGIGSSNHPSVTTHIRAAGVLATQLEVWCDWNIVYSNIVQETS